MLEKTKTTWLYLLCSLFMAIHGYLLVRDMYWALMTPFIIILVYLYLYKLDVIMMMIVFATPLAVNLIDQEFGVGVSVPTEPLMFGVVAVFLLRLLYENKYDRNILRHPVTIIILIQLSWIFITSLTSQLPVVSFKFLLARLWFVIPFFFLGVLFFKKVRNIRLFIWLYTIPLLILIGYTTYNH